jgi:uncharacterized protein YjbJ (UPF0337 family)
MSAMTEPTANGTFRKGFGQVQERFGALIGDDQTRLKGYANQAHGTLGQWVGRAADTLDEALQRAPTQVQGPGRRATEFARAKPLVTTLVLGAAALLLSRGSRRR